MAGDKRIRAFLTNLALVLGSLLVVLFVGEAVVRIKHVLVPIDLGDTIVPDDALGWSAPPNYWGEVVVQGPDGAEHRAQVETDAHGFRAFGNARSEKPVVFFIGDSFTFAKDIAHAETYYGRIGEALDVEVFAYGAEGFATLQECLVLDAWLDEIEPDVVVWQWCYNDFIGNLYELTHASAKYRCAVPQPFIQPDGSTRYLNPGDGAVARFVAPTRSEFLKAIAHRVDWLRGDRPPPLAEDIDAKVEHAGAQHKGFRESVARTDIILAMAAERVGAIPVIAFNVSSTPPWDDAFRRLAAKRGFAYVDAVARSAERAVAGGEQVFGADEAHWNALGHRYCAEALAPAIREALHGSSAANGSSGDG